MTNQFKQAIVLSHDSKELFVQCFMKVFDQNQSMFGRENKEQAPQLTSLCRCRTVRSSHWRCCIRKLFLKSLHYPQETPVLEPIFKKSADLQTSNFIKKRLQQRCFPVNIEIFLILPILKNICCKRLLFNFFNGSLLDGPKGLRSRLYDGARLQGPSHRS